MKQVWTVICLFLLVNALFLAGFSVWLYASGRVDRVRLAAAVGLFAPTLEAQRTTSEKAQHLSDEAHQRAVSLARMQAAEQGPTSLTARMESDRRVKEHAGAQLQRYREDVAVLRTQIAGARQRLRDERTTFEAEREAYHRQIEEAEARRQGENFKLSVQMYEQVKPKQAKQMFQELMDRGETEKVVDYLAAMSLRKAGAILKQFRTDQEISQASHLLQQLQARGVEAADMATRKRENAS